MQTHTARQPHNLADYVDSVWQLTPTEITTNTYRIHGYQTQRHSHLTTELSPASKLFTDPQTAAKQAGTAAREVVDDITGHCRTIAAATTARLHKRGVPATVQQYRVSDGQQYAIHYATLARLPRSTFSVHTTTDNHPYSDHHTDNESVQYAIVDASLDQFDAFNFGYHPNTPWDSRHINPVEVVTTADGLKHIYQPLTLTGSPLPENV